jgi:hypothetical protein
MSETREYALIRARIPNGGTQQPSAAFLRRHKQFVG